MNLTPAQLTVLHVLFSFAQAEHKADRRILARLLLTTQREVGAHLTVLEAEGLVRQSPLELTNRGLTLAAATRRLVCSYPNPLSSAAA